jgi:tRNA 2-thiocytidine biosynthesis protein TtcA
MDKHHYDFESLRATGVADINGDIAFDADPCMPPSKTVQLVHFGEG